MFFGGSPYKKWTLKSGVINMEFCWHKWHYTYRYVGPILSLIGVKTKTSENLINFRPFTVGINFGNETPISALAQEMALGVWMSMGKKQKMEEQP